MEGRKQYIDPRTGLCSDYGPHCAELICILSLIDSLFFIEIKS